MGRMVVTGLMDQPAQSALVVGSKQANWGAVVLLLVKSPMINLPPISLTLKALPRNPLLYGCPAQAVCVLRSRHSSSISPPVVRLQTVVFSV